MKNFQKNVQDASKEELLILVNNDITVSHLASDELTRRTIGHLNESIDKNTDELKQFASTTEKNSRVSEKFTAAMFILALVQLLVGLSQLLLSMFKSDTLQYKSLAIFLILASMAILTYFFQMIFPKKK